jgi:hypothetical protein
VYDAPLHRCGVHTPSRPSHVAQVVRADLQAGAVSSTTIAACRMPPSLHLRRSPAADAAPVWVDAASVIDEELQRFQSAPVPAFTQTILSLLRANLLARVRGLYLCGIDAPDRAQLPIRPPAPPAACAGVVPPSHGSPGDCPDVVAPASGDPVSPGGAFRPGLPAVRSAYVRAAHRTGAVSSTSAPSAAAVGTPTRVAQHGGAAPGRAGDASAPEEDGILCPAPAQSPPPPSRRDAAARRLTKETPREAAEGGDSGPPARAADAADPVGSLITQAFDDLLGEPCRAAT